MSAPDFFTRSYGYFSKQLDRVVAMLVQMNDRKIGVTAGRVMPEGGDLPIGVGKRFDAAVMFIDICDFSGWPSERQDEQEEILHTFTIFFSEIIKIVQDYDGRIEKNTGDGLMAYFCRRAGATEATVAVACALTIFDTVERLINPILESRRLKPVSFRICIDQGPITVAEVGVARGHRGIVAIGTTANIASKMLKHAGSMELLVGLNCLVRLPAEWQQSFVTLKTSESGWSIRGTGDAYPLYSFFGRWIVPALPAA